MEDLLARAPAWALVAAAVAAAVVLLELVRAALGRWWRGLGARRRVSRARAGEHNAEALLEALGYEVLERQARRVFRLEIDGRPHDVELRADLIVRRRGRRLVAEVKTGEVAPRIETRATRRQLLEYRLAYHDLDGVLLVAPESGTVHEVTFSSPLVAARRHVALALAAGTLVGAAAVWLLIGR
jgi:hypothetical protein